MPDSAEQSEKQLSSLARFARNRPLILFFSLAYAWSWIFWLIVPYAFHRNTHESTSDLFEIALILIGAWGPLLAALATRWLSHRDLKICPVWTGSRPMLAGLAVGLACFFIATVAVPALSLVKAPLRGLNWVPLLHWSTYAFNYSTLLGGPLTEEPGWRGFALPRLQARFGPYWATLILAPLWAGWHLPLFLVEGWTSASPGQFFLIILAVAFILTGAANLSKFNVLVAIVLHAFYNTSAGLVNALTLHLPPRPDPMIHYTFSVFICGSLLGLGAIAVWGTGRQTPPFESSGDHK